MGLPHLSCFCTNPYPRILNVNDIHPKPDVHRPCGCEGQPTHTPRMNCNVSERISVGPETPLSVTSRLRPCDGLRVHPKSHYCRHRSPGADTMEHGRMV